MIDDVSLTAQLRERARAVEPVDRLDDILAGVPAVPVVAAPRFADGAPRSITRRVLATAAVVVLLAAVWFVLGHRSGTTTPAAGDQPFTVHTGTVDLSADSFTVTVGGHTFDPQGQASLAIHSDPGFSDYTTLELSWTQFDAPMNVNLYFASDGSTWRVTEMRTYNGRSAGSADWVTFAGPRMATPLGASFRGDVDLTASEGGITSHLVIRGLTLRPTFGPGAEPTTVAGVSSCAATSSGAPVDCTAQASTPDALPQGAAATTVVPSKP